MKVYVTFGQSHIHDIAGKIFDKNCVAMIECENETDGRNIANDVFDRKWCWLYTNESDITLVYYPRGIIKLH